MPARVTNQESFIVPLRVTQQNEIEGLDVTQHGEALQ